MVKAAKRPAAAQTASTATENPSVMPGIGGGDPE
jgi:hypothetical protein